MRIKEVEQETGLTAKAIRLYESKGLLTVERNTGNDYRDYSEEDVKRLKTIAVLRKLEIPISDIKRWADGEVAQTELLHGAAYQSQMKADEMAAQQKLTGELLEILKEEPEKPLDEAIAEAEELRVIYQELDDAVEAVHGTLLWPLCGTFLALGLVGIVLLCLHQGKSMEAMVPFLLSLAAVPNALRQWRNYVRTAPRKRIPIKLTGTLWAVLGIVVFLAMGLGSMYFVVACQREWFAPAGTMLLSRPAWMVVLWFVPLLLIGGVRWNRLVGRDYAIVAAIILTIYGISFYGAVVSCTTFDGAQFCRHSFFYPAGKVYAVTDLERVEAGFSGPTLNLLKEKGEFYYRITFADGPTEDWGERLDILAELDEALMQAGVPKRVNTKHRKDFPLDGEGLAICDEILANTG